MSEKLLARQIAREQPVAVVTGGKKSKTIQPTVGNPSSGPSSAPVSGASVVMDKGVARKVALARRGVEHEKNIADNMEQFRRTRMPSKYQKEVEAAAKVAAKLIGSKKDGSTAVEKKKNATNKSNRKVLRGKAISERKEREALEKI
jgi:hypothetical protein